MLIIKYKINKKKNTGLVKQFFKVLWKCRENLRIFKNILQYFEKFETIIWSFCEKFWGQDFSPISLCSELYTAERDVR